MFRNAALFWQSEGWVNRGAAALLMIGLLQNSLFAQSLRFESIKVDAPGRVSLRLAATAGKTYLLESSSTLNGWNQVASRTADQNVIEFVQPLDAPARFFRALEINLEAVPGSDQFATAGELKGAVATGRATNTGASSEAGEPDHSWFDAGKNSVWWKWTAPGSGRATLSVIGSHFETLIAVYSGSAAGSLQTVAKNRRSSKLIGFDAKAGNTYHIAVAGHFSATGDIRLALQLNSSTTAAAPKSVVGCGIFFDETSNPNIPLRILDVNPDGLWWQDRDNGSSDAVDLGTVIGYEANGAVGMLILAAHRASETNTIRYTFTFETESTGAYSYSIDGVPSESGRFANFRDARIALAPP